MLNTERQSFITRQTLKQLELERNGITSASFLPAHLMVPVCFPRGTRARAEVTSSRHSRIPEDTRSRMRMTRPTPNDLDRRTQGHGLRAVDGQYLSACSKLRSDRLVANVDRPVRPPYAINSSVGAVGMTSSKGGEPIMTSPGKFKTALRSPLPANNYSTSVRRH